MFQGEVPRRGFKERFQGEVSRKGFKERFEGEISRRGFKEGFQGEVFRRGFRETIHQFALCYSYILRCLNTLMYLNDFLTINLERKKKFNTTKTPKSLSFGRAKKYQKG